MQSEDKIKDIFSSKLTNFEPDVPVDMWDRIDQDLPLQQTVMPRRKIFLRRTLTFAAGIAAVACLGILFLINDGNVAEQLSSGTPMEDHTPIFFDNKGEQQRAGEIRADAKASSNKSLYANAIVLSSSHENISPVEPVDNSTTQEKGISEQEPVQNIASEPENKKVDEKTLKEKIEAFERLGQDIGEKQPSSDGYSKTEKSGKGFALMIGGGSGLSDIDDKRTPAPSNFLKYAMMGDLTEDATITTDVQELRRKGQVKIDHSQPVSFGLKVNKRFNNDVSIETGIVYTYLHSKIKPVETSDAYKAEGDQKFHYLGLPVSVNYTFARLEKAEFQISLGAMIQKDVAGKIEGDQEIKDLYIDNSATQEDKISEKISQDKPQFSFMANVGASYPIYDKLNVYATVGGAYYPDAGNEYPTIYSDKKLQLDLNLGLKLKF